MPILAIDTATRNISLALATETRLLAEHTWHTANNHTLVLAPSVNQILGVAGIKAADLDAIAIAIGPGSFTGLRIGLALAKGMAIANGTPLIGIPSLDIVAQAQSPGAGTLIAVLQSGRKRIAAQPYRWQTNQWVAKEKGQITNWEALFDAYGNETLKICGEIDDAGYAYCADRAQIMPAAKNVRRAATLAQLAYQRFNANDIDDTATLAPDYWHLPTITPPKTRV